MGELHTLSAIGLKRIPVNGKPRNLDTLKRMVAGQNVPHVDTTIRGAKLYDLDILSAAMIEHEKQVQANRHAGGVKAGSNRQLAEEKLKQQVELLQKTNKLKQLELSEKSKQLLSVEEVKKFLVFRYEAENAILRRIFSVNVPLDLPGLDIQAARSKCEDYYNTVQAAKRETLKLYDINIEEVDKYLNEEFREIIDKLDNSLLPRNTKSTD